MTALNHPQQTSAHRACMYSAEGCAERQCKWVTASESSDESIVVIKAAVIVSIAAYTTLMT